MAFKRKVYYLNLELETPSKMIKSLAEKYTMECHCSTHSNIGHELNSTQPILNTIIDLLITLGIRIEEFDKQLSFISKHIEKKNSYGTIIEDNLQYVKTQNDDILRKLNKSKQKELIHTENLSPLQKEILDEIEDIKQVLKELKQIIIT